jgi:diacylglycerol kinase (ATP)
MTHEPAVHNHHSPDSESPLTVEKPPVGFDHDHSFLIGRWFSFRVAVAGAIYTLRTQPNTWIELVAIAVVIAAGLWLGISRLEWAMVGLTCALVLALEAVNTAVEAIVDLVSPGYHPLARIAKDTAAGAMVFAIVGSLCVAGFIFGPRLWQWLFP